MRVSRTYSVLCFTLAAAVALGAASPEAGHCLTACGHGAADGGEPCGSQPGLSADHEEPATGMGTTCVGPSCLCHQRGLAPRSAGAVALLAFGAPAEAPAPLCDLCGAREVLHVPRALAPPIPA